MQATDVQNGLVMDSKPGAEHAVRSDEAKQIEEPRLVDYSFDESELMGHTGKRSIDVNICIAILNFVPPIGVA